LRNSFENVSSGAGLESGYLKANIFGGAPLRPEPNFGSLLRKISVDHS